jgi:hypothetical protein
LPIQGSKSDLVIGVVVLQLAKNAKIAKKVIVFSRVEFISIFIS